MGEMNPELFEHYKKRDYGIQEGGTLPAKVKY